jgi:phosphatidylglycerol:prolipoprotein diacylglycerol transferase
MAFHGGALGVIVAFWLFARRYNLRYLELMDKIVCAVPLGLLFGRLANFINGELYGRVTDASFGMVFPNGGPLPRHPSQLYEAALEGLLLFILLFLIARFTRLVHRHGFVSGLFLLGYGASRFAVEFFREPDAQLGLLQLGLTMGQWLSIPMMGVGLWLMLRALLKGPVAVREREYR